MRIRDSGLGSLTHHNHSGLSTQESLLPLPNYLDLVFSVSDVLTQLINGLVMFDIIPTSIWLMAVTASFSPFHTVLVTCILIFLTYTTTYRVNE